MVCTNIFMISVEVIKTLKQLNDKVTLHIGTICLVDYRNILQAWNEPQ